MRILLVHDTGYEIGGAEVMVRLLKEEWLRRGHEVKLVSEVPPRGADSFADFAAPSPGVPYLSKLWSGRALRNLRQVIATYQPDVVNFHTIDRASPALLSVARNLPCFLTVHNETLIKATPLFRFFSEGKWPGIPSFFNPQEYYRTFRYLAARQNMPALKRIWVATNYIASQITYPQISVLVQKCTFGIASLPLLPLPQTPSLLFMGRLVPEKGADYLLHALAEIRKQIPEVTLTIAGDGSEAENLNALCRRLNLESAVTFAGQVPHERIEQLLLQAAVVVVPSVWQEPFGLSGLEAMLAGRPVIGTRVGGIPEWLEHGKTGLLAEPANVAALAESAVTLLQNPALMQTMGYAGHQKAAHYSIAQSASEMESVFRQFLPR